MNQLSSKPPQSESALIELITLDCDHILTHAGGDPILLMQLCGAFLNELPIRMQSARAAIVARDYPAAGRALQPLRNCLIVFGSGPVSVTVEMLEAAVLAGHPRAVSRHWKHLQRQLEILVPQVQRLMLESSTPQSAVQ